MDVNFLDKAVSLCMSIEQKRKLRNYEKAVLLCYMMEDCGVRATSDAQITVLANLCFDRNEKRAQDAFEEAVRRRLISIFTTDSELEPD